MKVKQDEYYEIQHHVTYIGEKCKLFIDTRNSTRRISTTQIFDLISLAKTYLNINAANILDLSCNVVSSINPDDTCDTCDTFSISGNCYVPEEGWAYGGKRKTKKYKKRN